MTKILSSATYNVLKAKADNFDKVVESVVTKNTDLAPEDVTLEVIEAAIATDEPVDTSVITAQVTELNGTVETLNDTIAQLTTERDALTLQVEELSALPGAESVDDTIPAAEATALDADDLLDFATKNAGDTMAIAAKMTETGFIKQK